VTSPSARDRAIEIVAVAIATVNAEHMTGSELYSPPATAAVDALLASPGVLAALAGEREAGQEVQEPEDGGAFFAAAMDEHGRCTCADNEDCNPGSSRCVLCNVLPGGWPCPTPAHEGYPQPAPVGGVDTPTEPTANEPEHEALTRALAAAGWARVGGRVGHYDRLRNDSLPEVTVIVPTDPAAPDYRELLDAARASTRLPVHPGVVELLERCDVEDRVAGEYGWIQTTEVRALLTEGDQK
jgi:hypothetical protein